MPVLEEELDVHKRRVETDAGVRISKHITQREEVVDVPLARTDVDVERIAVNRAIDTVPAIRHEGDTMIIPIVEEVLVVEKRLMLKEELRVTQRKHEVREPQRVTLRSEHAQVERFTGAGDRSSKESDTSLLEQKRRQDEELRRNLGGSSER